MPKGEFCPVAKSVELLGEKWTLLIARDLLMGSTRFNELQRGLLQISPTMLTRRLESMIENQLVVKKKISGQKGCEYHPTPICRKLVPVLEAMGEWGSEWVSSSLTEKNYDIDLLTDYLRHSVDPQDLPSGETVLCFNLSDIKEYPRWWMVINGSRVDLCVNDPGKEVDAWCNTDVETLINVWMGNSTSKAAMREGHLRLTGDKFITRNFSNTITTSDSFADLPPAINI